jgi:hypothetical protein
MVAGDIGREEFPVGSWLVGVGGLAGCIRIAEQERRKEGHPTDFLRPDVAFFCFVSVRFAGSLRIR